jgi:acyl-coenzyme A synthetase/AMP-(fatty) acid ligase
VPNIPKTNVGKIDRKELRKMAVVNQGADRAATERA